MSCSVPQRHPKQLGILVGIQKDAYENAKRMLKETVEFRAQEERQRVSEKKVREAEKKRLAAKKQSAVPKPLPSTTRQLGVAGTLIGINKNLNPSHQKCFTSLFFLPKQKT